MLLALPDAVNLARAGKTTIAYLHFLPLAYFIACVAARIDGARSVFTGVLAVFVFWVIDALIQQVTGQDVFGYPSGEFLTGAFYPKQRLGLVLAVLLPLALVATQQRWWPRYLGLTVVCLSGLVMLLSLKRTAWIMLFVALAGYIGAFAWQGIRARPARALGAVLIVMLAITLAVSLSPRLQTRLASTVGVFSHDYGAIDAASSYRLSLWRTGTRIFQAHWFNGVGPRGYRYVYQDYAPADDFWLARSAQGQTHPHLMVLEIGLETGVLGLLGYGLVLLVLVKKLLRSSLINPHQASWTLAVLVAIFPLNAHLAFYGSYWASFSWLLLGMVAATDTEHVS